MAASYCGPWGECVLCDAIRTGDPEWKPVVGGERFDEAGNFTYRNASEVSRMFWVRRSRRRTQRIRGEAWRNRDIPFTEPLEALMPVDPHLFPYWRVWLKNQRGGERYVDVTGAGYGFLRAANGIKDRGEWIDRWQPLIVPTLGNRYPLRHRLRVAWRSWRRSRAR